jgi:hypothetical protein
MLGLSANLRSPARIFYMSISQDERADYYRLVDKLAQRFGSVRQQNKWLGKFEARKRQQGESIAALWDDLPQMAQKSYRKLDTLAQEALALNQLYKSISLEMKSKSIDAVDVIEQHEAIFELNDKKKPNIVRQLTANDYSLDNTDKNVSDEDLYTVHSINSKATPLNQGPRHQISQSDTLLLKQISDRIANLEGSLLLKSQNHYNYNQQPRFDINSRSVKACYHCNSPDHFIRDCPKRNRPSNNEYYQRNNSSGQSHRNVG